MTYDLSHIVRSIERLSGWEVDWYVGYGNISWFTICNVAHL